MSQTSYSNPPPGDLSVLSPRESVRKRPGMYVGNVHDGWGARHLIDELVGNALDQHLLGHCSRIDVRLRADGSVSVDDDGPGIPVETEIEGTPFLERIMTSWLDRPTRYEAPAVSRYTSVARALHGPGVWVLNHLSSWVDVEVHRGGARYAQRFEDGVPVRPLEVVGRTCRTGTRISSLPDPSIVQPRRLPFSNYVSWFGAQVIPTPGLSLALVDEASGASKQLYFPEGVASCVAELTAKRRALVPGLATFRATGTQYGVSVDVAILWCQGPRGALETIVNGGRTLGGTHADALMSSVLEAMNDAATALGVARPRRARATLEQLFVRTGATVCLSVILGEPEWRGATKDHLQNVVASRAVTAVVMTSLPAFLLANPGLVRAVAQR